MMWFHRCTTYYHYLWQVGVGGTVPEEGAVVFTAILIFVNLINLNLILKLFFNVPVVALHLNMVLIILIIAILFILNYQYLAARNKFEVIKEEFENRIEGENKKRKIITIAYTLLSFVLMFALAVATR